MDEIEWIKITKKAIKFISITAIIISMAFGIIAAIATNVGKKGMIFSIVLMLCVGIILVTINLLAYGILYLIYKIIYIKPEFIHSSEYNVRDLDNYYPPAIVSLIHNFNIEVYRDYTATILNLYLKNYINISSFSDNIQFYKTEKKDISKLQNHEIYVYNCIINDEKFDDKKFKKMIYVDAEECGLIKEKYTKEFQEKIAKITAIILGILYMLLLIYLGTKFKNDDNIVICIMGCVMLIPIIGYRKGIYNFLKKLIKNFMPNYKMQLKGEKERKTVKAFKNYLDKYTLIKEKEIDYIEILERYIPYSLVLGEAETVEEYIKQNEKYRNLIYKKTI